MPTLSQNFRRIVQFGCFKWINFLSISPFVENQVDEQSIRERLSTSRFGQRLRLRLRFFPSLNTGKEPVRRQR